MPAASASIDIDREAVEAEEVPLGVLVVHRSERVRGVLETLLSKPGPLTFRYESTGSAADALQRLGEREFDVILYGLLEESPAGVGEVPRALRDFLTRAASVPVVVVTQSDASDLGGAAVLAGAADFLRLEELSLTELHRSLSYAVARRSFVLGWVQQELFAHLEILAHGVAHQFNNLNTAINGYAQLLHTSPNLSDEDRARVEKILEVTDRTTALVSRLLAAADASGADVTDEHLDAVVSEQLKLVIAELGGREIHLDQQLETVPAVRMRRPLIGQAVLGILVNAVHSLELGPRSERRLVARTGHDDEWVWVEIADSGLGIAGEDQSRLFCPFFGRKGEHAAGGPAKAQRGAGLGLSIAYGIVRAHGGRLDVNSRRRRGAVFRLALPRSSVQPALGSSAA